MGTRHSQPLTAQEKNRDFLHRKGHKIYVITAPDVNFIKVGYTNRTLYQGVWQSYRRAYGEDQVIVRVFACQMFKEDEVIHKLLHPKYGYAAKKREIYQARYLKQILAFLDQRYGGGVGPFTKADVVWYNKHVQEPEEVLVSGLKFLKIS